MHKQVSMQGNTGGSVVFWQRAAERPKVTSCRMLQVTEIRRQANEALQQAQAEISEAEHAAVAAQQQVREPTPESLCRRRRPCFFDVGSLL